MFALAFHRVSLLCLRKQIKGSTHQPGPWNRFALERWTLVHSPRGTQAALWCLSNRKGLLDAPMATPAVGMLLHCTALFLYSDDGQISRIPNRTLRLSDEAALHGTHERERLTSCSASFQYSTKFTIWEGFVTCASILCLLRPAPGLT
jgi:hypothetical protein